MDKKDITSFTVADSNEFFADEFLMDRDMWFRNEFFIYKSFQDKGVDALKYPCRINSLIILLCTEGYADVTVNMDSHRISKGSMLVVLPNDIVQLNSLNDEAKGMIVGLSDSLMHESRMQINLRHLLQVMEKLRRMPAFLLSEENYDLVYKTMDLIYDMSHSQVAMGNRELFRELFSTLGLLVAGAADGAKELLESVTSASKSRGEQLFDQFVVLLMEHYREERQIGFYADKLCITPKYLSSLIKKSTGYSAAEWIDRYVIMEAKRLLKFSNMSIQEVAYHLNFSTQSFFGKYFKHLTGMSPSEYKNS